MLTSSSSAPATTGWSRRRCSPGPGCPSSSSSATSVLGGAARTEQPFRKVPGLRQSTGSYLLGLMPPELEQLLDLRLPLVRRDPHYFLPTDESTATC